MKNILNKTFLSIVVVFIGVLLNAQTETATAEVPPIPQETGGGSGDIGGISQPVDMYVIWLGIVAVAFIIYFVKQNQKRIA